MTIVGQCFDKNARISQPQAAQGINMSSTDNSEALGWR